MEYPYVKNLHFCGRFELKKSPILSNIITVTAERAIKIVISILKLLAEQFGLKIINLNSKCQHKNSDLLC